jgi:hypothetical protein
MIGLFKLLLPYILVLFFLAKGLKESLFLLGIPFLLFMSDSLFFDSAQLFHIPGSLDNYLLFIWLVFLWIISKAIPHKKVKKELKNHSRLNMADYIILGLSILAIIGLLITITSYPDTTNVPEEFIPEISLFAGYFIIKDWSSNNRMEILEKFLFSIVVINSLAAVLYILNQGMHISIYNETEGVSDYFQGVEIVRIFYFMPQFLFFSIAFLLVNNKKYSYYSIALLIINIFAVFITYTRSYLIIILALFLFYFILTGLKKGNFGLILKNLLLFAVIGIFGFFLLSKFLPTSTKYFMDRFSELTEKSSTGEENNLDVRFNNNKALISKMDKNGILFGMGPVTEKQFQPAADVHLITSDMVWIGVLFRWGILGLALFIALYLFSIYSAFSLFMKSDGILSDFALLFLLYIISQVIESFTSWTFMSGHGYATGLWYFAIFFGVSGYYKRRGISDEAEMQIAD